MGSQQRQVASFWHCISFHILRNHAVLGYIMKVPEGYWNSFYFSWCFMIKYDISWSPMGKSVRVSCRITFQGGSMCGGTSVFRCFPSSKSYFIYRTVVMQLFSSTGVFSGTEDEISLWLEQLCLVQECDREEVILFVQSVFTAILLKDPYSYTEQVRNWFSKTIFCSGYIFPDRRWIFWTC